MKAAAADPGWLQVLTGAGRSPPAAGAAGRGAGVWPPAPVCCAAQGRNNEWSRVFQGSLRLYTPPISVGGFLSVDLR
jgi:hypothetical protein